uniref:Ubiquitin-protein ligase E3B n=1 Tax=Aceria tosichella TaxID=561515 RepID=A0A6G1SIZ1_9ACAR
MNSSGLSQARTKDEFLNKAHEARLARELARCQDNSAIVIQSHVRRFITWRRLNNSLNHEQENLQASYKSGDSAAFMKSIRKILFFSRTTKDRDNIDTLFQFIHQTRSNIKTIPRTEDNDEVRIINNNDTTSEIEAPQNDPMFLLVDAASKDEETFMTCIHTLSRLVDICCRLIIDQTTKDDNPSKHPDLTSMIVYIDMINMLTHQRSSDLSSMMNDVEIAHVEHKKLDETYEKFVSELSKRTSSSRQDAFITLSDSIAKIIKGPRTDAKGSLLAAYIQMALSISINQLKHDNSSTDNQAKLLIKLFSVPALIYYLECFSCDSLATFKEKAVLESCFKVMSAHNQQLQNLSSTPALCLVANLVHLFSMTEDTPSTDLIPFVTVITKLLERCQKNMKQLKNNADSTNITQRDARKMNDATDESYNHILGWLIRDAAYTTDQETSELIKSQLSHLWSVKFLKLLFSDLIKANESQKSSTDTGRNKSSLNESPRRSSRDDSSQTKCDSPNQNASITSFKRAVERAAYNMTKSIGYPYNKTTSPSGLYYSSAKLLSEEAKRISLVCLMLHTALKTLKMIKQDILTGLCFHDYVLRNLWNYISSLSPNNGLKAFLDHLVINSKSSMPEFHILMLFCECASHIISILDDSELYEQQRPFTLDDLVNISTFLNTFVFRIINNQLVSYKAQEMDPILRCTHKLLTDLYKRDCRRTFAPQGHWLIKDLKMSLFLKDLDAGKSVAQAILNLLPHIIPHKERVLIFRKLVARDRSACYSTFITIHRSRIVEDGYQQLARLPSTALKGLIRVKFINDHGLDEAGIDQDGVFKEFLEDTIKRVFDPALNLFSTTSEQRLYPSPTSRLHEDHLSLFNFVGKMLGKAVYEGIVVDVPFATFFLARVLGQHHSKLYSPIDDLASLDPELYKNLIYIRHHDVSDLDLTFSIDQDMMGKIENFELEPGGRHIPVTNQNRVRYIHSVANFRMRTQIEEQTKAFICGFKSIVNLEWLHMFSASEFQRLISGDTAPIDLQDLRRHTKYFGGFHNNHRVICWLWDILESDFTPEEHSLFLKFVTSCSKPPLLGFENLEPPFSIRCVEVSDDQDLGDTVGSVLRGFFAIRRSDPVDRLPTSSTCFNLLKLPNYQRRSTLREKLRYAIRSSPGFELS